jgi:hypothetical protein
VARPISSRVPPFAGTRRLVLLARWYLLQRPGIAIWVTEGDEGAPRLNVDVARCDAVGYKLLSGCFDIFDDNLHPPLRARCHIGDPCSHYYRAGGPGRGELYKAQRVVDLVVVVGRKTNLVDVEVLCPIDVIYGN